MKTKRVKKEKNKFPSMGDIQRHALEHEIMNKINYSGLGVEGYYRVSKKDEGSEAR